MKKIESIINFCYVVFVRKNKNLILINFYKAVKTF